MAMSLVADAGLPPTTIQGQNDTSAKTKFSFQVPNNQFTDLGGVKALIQTGNDNLLTNPTFQASTATQGWTLGTGVTAAIDATTKFGNESTLKLTLTAASGDLLYQDVPVSNVAGINEESSLTVLNSSGLAIQACSRQNVADVSGACVSVPNGAVWSYTPSAGSVGGSGTTSIGVSLYASASTSGNVWLTHAYTGKTRLIGTVAQAQLIGSMTWTPAASCTWATTSATFTNLSANASCSAPTAGVNASAPATKIPGITFSSLAPGDYLFVANGTFGNGGNNASFFRFSDGTNNTPGVEMFGSSQITESNISGHITYTAPQTNITIQLQAAASSATAANITLSNTSPSVGMEILVYYFPTQSQTVASLAQASAEWAGYFTNTFSVTPTANTWQDFTGSAGSISTPPTATNKNITCTQISGNYPGLSCSVPKAAQYKICASTQLTSSAGGFWAGIQMTDSGNNAISPGGGVAITGASYFFPTGQICGYETTTGSTVTAKLRANSSGTTAYSLGAPFAGNASVMWTVEQSDSPGPQPYTTGNVSSTSAGMEHVERASITNGGSCAITSQSGSWLSGISHSGTGTCPVTITATEFSGTETCSCTTSSVNIICYLTSKTTSGFTINTENTSGTAVDSNADVICMGPH